MSDDLVKRLREDQPVTQDMESTMQCALQDATADRIEALEAELHLLKTSGIAEVAVRNQNVMEYMRHWEGRAEAADAELEKQLKIAAANEESEGAASFRVSRFMYEMTGGKDE